MTDHTINLIMTIKHSDKKWNQAVAEYMSAYSGSPVEAYGEFELNQIMKNAFLDYIATCDEPVMAVRALLTSIEKNGSLSLGYRIAVVLELAKVKENKEYVNGFRYSPF